MTGPFAPARPAQLTDPVTVRYVGLGFVLLLVAAFLYMVVRYGDADRGGGDEDSGDLFLPGPAYGLTGTNDVEEVLMVDGERPGREGDDASDGRTASDGSAETTGRRGADEPTAGNEPAANTRATAGDGPGGPATDRDGDDGGRFSHDVRERRDGEWLVEVTDGDRSARFLVSRTGSVLTIDPVASPARRHGTNWVVAAERYLRDREFAVGTERE